MFYHTIWPEKSEIVITFFAIHTYVLTVHQTKNEQSFPGSVQSSITYPFRAVGRSENPVGKSLVTQPMLQRQPNWTELRLMV